jgi:hypothetical protein
MYTAMIKSINFHIDRWLSDLQNYLRKEVDLIVVLAVLAVAAYGFELFNLNLTIDEEVYAATTGPTLEWIAQGRWGMYLLNKFVMPYTIIPFVPLFVALLFHIIATLLLLEGWEVRSKPTQFVVGAIYVTFPTMAFMYTFSTINYGIGIGLFCISLSLFIYSKIKGLNRFWAIIPGSFAIAIYQGFIPALAAVYLVYLILLIVRGTKSIIKEILVIAIVLTLSVFIYYAVQKLILFMGIVQGLPYVSGFFSLKFLLHYYSTVLFRLWSYLIVPIYLGNEKVYSIKMTGISILLLVSSISLFIASFKARISAINRILIAIFYIALLALPFLSGIFMQGYMSYRFLTALPIVIAGVVMLGMINTSRLFNFTLIILSSFCILQFVTSTNHLFASSHLALEADRLLASRLIGRIEEAQAETGSQPLKFLEIIGYYKRPPTQLIPKIETFGASFFEWEDGSSSRISHFLQTVGFPLLRPLPVNQQALMVSIAETMPEWPEKGSVKIVNDVVLVKFGDYSGSQKAIICGTKESRSYLKKKNFCKGQPKPQ